MPLQLPDHPIAFIRAKPRWTTVEWVISLVLLVPLTGVCMYMWRWGIIDEDVVRQVMRNADAGLWLGVVAMALSFAFAFGFVAYRANKTARLVVDAEGIRLEPAATTAWLAAQMGGRKVAWSQLAHVTHLTRFNVIQLVSKGALGKIRPIRLSDWKLPYPAGLPSEAILRGGQPDLLRVLDQIQVFQHFPPSASAESMNFDLMGHPATRFVLVVLGLLGGYAVVDRFLQREAWAFFNLAYVVPHVVVGLILACAVLAYLMKARALKPIPHQVTSGLAVLAVLVIGPASYIGGIRINQAFAGPLVSADYRRSAGCDTLVPQDAKLPIVEYTLLASGYWCSIPASQSIPVRVRQGFFGLYQMDLSEHTEAIRAYRQTH